MRSPLNSSNRFFKPSMRYLSGLALSAFVATTWAATPRAEIEAQYQHDRSVCLSGKSNQDQAACLKEAGAVRAEALRGKVDDVDTNYRRNQLDRCKALSGDEAKDCKARMKGAGTVNGSVGSGGIYRELTTIEPAPAASAASAP